MLRIKKINEIISMNKMQYSSLDVLMKGADDIEVLWFNQKDGKFNDLLGLNLDSIQTVGLEVQNQKVFKCLSPYYSLRLGHDSKK